MPDLAAIDEAVTRHGAAVVVTDGPFKGFTGRVCGWYTHSGYVIVVGPDGRSLAVHAQALCRRP